MLLSATVVFFPLVSFDRVEISIGSIMKAIFSGYGSSGIASELIDVLGTYAKPYIVMMLFWFVFTVASAVSVLTAKKKAVFLGAILEQIIQIFIAIWLYVKIKSKLSLVYRAVSFFGFGNGIKIHILPILFWAVLQIICFVVNIIELTAKEESLQENDLPPIPPNWNPGVGSNVIDDVEETTGNQTYEIPFYGAVIGNSIEYAKLAFQMKEKEKVFFKEEGTHILLQERLHFDEKNILADVYYVPEHKEYCITPAKRRTVFLESGQPLGEGRLYYLPRATRIRIQGAAKEDWFELA